MRHRSARTWFGPIILVSLALCLTATLALARPGVVRTRDGQSFEGDVIEREGTVSIIINGIETRVDRRNVASLQYTRSFDEVFQERLAALQPNDLAGRMTLAREAYQLRRYDLADAALDAALRVDPNSREATDLQDLVRRQIRLERSAGAAISPSGAPLPVGATPTTQPNAAQSPTTSPVSLPLRDLTTDEVNIVKQKEARWPDAQVRIRFDNDVQNRFIANSSYSRQQFNRLSPGERARLILEQGAPEMAWDITLINDPQPMLEFRRTAQPIILTGCAAANCHGGRSSATEGFKLHSPASNDIAVYTNFLALQEYQTKVGDVSYMMIDRAIPERSLLLQFGLPQEIADAKHPVVEGFRPVFTGRNDPRYQRLLEWMRNSLNPVRPVYGVELSKPPTTRPVTR